VRGSTRVTYHVGVRFLATGDDAVGVIAVGPNAMGLLAIGVNATGVIALGFFARGLLAIGLVAVGGCVFAGGFGVGVRVTVAGVGIGGIVRGGGAGIGVDVDMTGSDSEWPIDARAFEEERQSAPPSEAGYRGAPVTAVRRRVARRFLGAAIFRAAIVAIGIGVLWAAMGAATSAMFDRGRMHERGE